VGRWKQCHSFHYPRAGGGLQINSNVQIRIQERQPSLGGERKVASNGGGATVHLSEERGGGKEDTLGGKKRGTGFKLERARGERREQTCTLGKGKKTSREEASAFDKEGGGTRMSKKNSGEKENKLHKPHA